MPVPISAHALLHTPTPSGRDRWFLEQHRRLALADAQRRRVAQRARPGSSVRSFLARTSQGG